MNFQNYDDNEILKGTVEEIVYYNDDNGYAVCYINTSDNDYVAVVGYLPLIASGESVTLNGRWTFHPEYGKQFKADCYEKNMPREVSEILKYLSSGIIKGVRQATAEKIVNMFGENSLDIIARDPERLAEINGISKRKAKEIGESYSLQIGVRDVVLFFQKFNVAPSFAVKVYKRYGINSVDIIKENPYLLAEEVNGIGFVTADKIAMSMGMEKNCEQRIYAAINYCLWEAAMNGHTFLPRKVLETNTSNLINVDSTEAGAAITAMLFMGKLNNENNATFEAIYLPAMHSAEYYTAAKLIALAQNKNKLKVNVDQIIKETEKDGNILLSDRQRDAVEAAVKNNVMVITGGPGTGKTTIIRTIIAIMDKLKKTVMLAAPTGRASERMSEMCEMEASTIHRLLEAGYSEDDDTMLFGKDNENPLECDVLIVDEMSMVDILLMNSLLKAIKKGTRLIMVGDRDQLPSVGPGYVLHDIMASGCVPVITLTDIFRQANESMIVVNAHKINHGEMPVLNQKGSDFFIVKRENAQDIVSTVVELCTKRLPSSYGVDCVQDIQVLTPSRKSVTGVNILNEKLQEAINPPTKTKNVKQFKNYIFREGDKVMQIKNNYDLPWENPKDKSEGMGIYNGDIGFIEKIDSYDESATIVFGDKVYIYPFAKLDELRLAYAMTVHKSQGSEFDIVVMPMYPVPPMLASRNILYTAVTRAKRMVVLVGRTECIAKMVNNATNNNRYSGLLDKMRIK